MRNKLQKTPLLLVALVCLMGLLTLTGCLKQSNVASMVPKDASVVCSIDMNSIWTKGNLDNINNIAFIRYFRQELRDEDPDAAAILNEILDDPNSCGIKLKDEIVLFSSESLHSEICVGFLVNNADRFEEFIRHLNRTLDADLEIREEEDFSFASSYDNSLAFCWNSKKAYILVADRVNTAKSDARDLMSLTDKNSMASNSDFNQLMNNRRDIKLFVNSQNLADMMAERRRLSYREEEMLDNLKDAAACLSLNFEQGAIKLELNARGIETEGNLITDDFNSQLTRYLPQESYANAAFAVNVDQLIQTLEGIDDIDLDEDFEGISIRRLIKCFTGSFAACVSDVTVNRRNKPRASFTVVAGINNARTIQRALDDIFEDEGSSSRGEYTYDLYDGYYAKFNDDVLMISNDRDVLDDFSDGGSGRELARNRKNGYAYANLNIDDYPSSLRRAIGRNLADLLSGYLKDAELHRTGDFQWELTIGLQNTEKNSLEFTLQHLDDNMTLLERL